MSDHHAEQAGLGSLEFEFGRLLEKVGAGLEPDALVPVIAAVYDLQGTLTCEWLGSGLNDVFSVTSESGRYALKVYRAGWRTAAQVQAETAALLHLDRKGVRVALPVERRDGVFAWQVTVLGHTRQVLLFAWAAGAAIEVAEPRECRLLGDTLAAIHNATDDFHGAEVRFDADKLFAAPMALVEVHLSDRPDELAFVRDLAGRLRRRISAPPPPTLDWGYCHGDFRAANVLLDSATNTTTSLDFELGGAGYRAYDLAYTLTGIHSLARRVLWHAPELDNPVACSTAFLDGYSARRPLRAADRELVPTFVAARAIEVLGYLLEQAQRDDGLPTWPPPGPNGLPGGDLFERTLRFLREWDACPA